MNTAAKSAVNPVTIPATIPAGSPEPALAKPPVRILKIASCPSLSGKSQLTYHVGYAVGSEGAAEGVCTEDIQLRVFMNTGMGFFSQEWVPLSVIQRELAKIGEGKTITSFQLHPLFAGKSVNTPAFLFAVLQSEGLVQRAKDSTRRYDRIDPAGFLAAVQALIVSGVDLKVDESPSKTGAGTVKNGAKASAKVAAKPADKTAKANVKSAAAKPAAKQAAGVDIAEIVEVINAKVGTKTNPATPEAKPAMPEAKPAMPTVRASSSPVATRFLRS